jgi:hypothetical protein
VAGILRELGYTQVTKKRMKVNGSLHYVWFNKNAMSDEEAKGRVRKWHEGGEEFVDEP